MAYGWNIQNLRDSLTNLGTLINNTTNLEDKYYSITTTNHNYESIWRNFRNIR